MKNKPIYATPLAEARAEWSDLYKEFAPTLTQYQAMAKRALGLQINIFNCVFREDFSQASHHAESLILKISARENPARLDQLLADLAKREIKVTRVVYDAHTFDFYLFGPS